jgi:hypothetical protein
VVEWWSGRVVEVDKMSKNYKLQNTNYKQITNYKLQITKKEAHELHELTRIPGRKYTGKITTKGSHGLHKDTLRLQTMTALMKSFCGGVQGGQFFKKAPPLVAEGKENKKR